MKNFSHVRIVNLLIGIVIVIVVGTGSMNAVKGNEYPVAEAGLPRYAAIEPVVLDGTGSYDLDESDLLSYTWQQLSGPSVTITDANTAAPTISDFIQTDEIQECQFKLLVNDGELTSLPDTVKVIIVPDFGGSTLELENPPFDTNKPTIVYFGGGDAGSGNVIDGMNGLTGPGQLWNENVWKSLANVISFPEGYYPDASHYEPWATYYQYGVYLSRVAPNYQQPIQPMGFSGGGMPNLDLGIRLNSYSDTRYAVHHVTTIDGATRAQPQFGGSWDLYLQGVELFLNSSVDGEPCWLDFYYGSLAYQYEPFPRTDILWIRSGFDHGSVRDWYRSSITSSDMNQFNGGVVAGAYWSVVGPGKNLQIARSDAYYFEWDGDMQSGSMDFYDETQFPGRLPEPVTLIGPEDGSFVDVDGAILSCEVSENSIGYQLLFGQDPYHMVYLYSDTPVPPNEQVTIYPFEKTWWTVKAYNQYGSTIYADPISIIPENVMLQSIENITTTKQYSSIQQAINDALDGQEIVISPGIFQYYENLDFKGKSLTLRSIDPNDPNVVANTVINGSNRGPTIQLSGSPVASCSLTGLTITSGTVSISCDGAIPTIQNCTVVNDGSIAIEHWDYSEPTIIDSNILGQINEIIDQKLAVCWPLDETTGFKAEERVAGKYGYVLGESVWRPEGGMVNGAIEFNGIDSYVYTTLDFNPSSGVFSVLAWIKGGSPGQVILSQVNAANWLSVDSNGSLMTELKQEQYSSALLSQTVITDGDWHLVGFIWDGNKRILYVDGETVAEDTQDNLSSSEGNLLIGTGNNTEAGTFWNGLIDDVRIYNRVITP